MRKFDQGDKVGVYGALTNAIEASLVENASIFPAQSLLQVAAHLSGKIKIEPFHDKPQLFTPHYPDFHDIKGQRAIKRALEVAATGNHSVLMVGPPGSGKSMLAGSFPGILPKMTQIEALETASVQSLDCNFDISKWKTRPFRAPHHTASGIALVGGGSNPHPGEISMALHGVLFLDELPEFDRSVLEVLREPMESGRIIISRAARRAEFPAQFQHIAAMNPCPCGYFGHHNVRCRCTPDQISRYRSKISGPFLDRIDIQVEVSAVTQNDLTNTLDSEYSVDLQKRVEIARDRQLNRQGKANAQLSVSDLNTWCKLDSNVSSLLQHAFNTLNLSTRAYHRIIKVARSIADLEGVDNISVNHMAEAIQYRRFNF